MRKLILAVVVVLIGIAGIAWWKKNGQQSEIQFTTAKVVEGDIVSTVSATGTLNPVVTVVVGSQVSGRIEKIFVDYNDEVKQGDVLAQIEPSTFKAKAQQAEAQLSKASANREDAKRNLKRVQTLFEERIASQSDLDTAMTKVDLSEADYSLAEASLNQAKVDLKNTTIHCPLDGIVISRDVSVGQTVAASLSSPTLFTIANDLAQMQINANVDEADIGAVQEGQKVRFTVDAFSAENFRGKVTSIRNSPSNNQGVVSYVTIIDVENPGRKLKPGMTASVNIVVAEKKDVMMVPNSALRYRPPEVVMARINAANPQSQTDGGSTNRRTGGGDGSTGGGANWSGEGRRGAGGGGGGRGERSGRRSERGPSGVWVLQNGQPARLNIKTGISDSSFTEILEGLTIDQEVVVGTVMPAGATAATQTGPGFSPFGQPSFGGGGRR